MTNREYIIALLSNKDCIDDAGASYESMVCYSINCPYFVIDERALCIKEGKLHNEQLCFKCTENWLNSEVD